MTTIIDSRLSFLAASFAGISLDSRIAPQTKAILEFGEVVNRMQI